MAEETQIHGFADASQRAYGACIYMRTTTEGKNHVVLLCAKSRVTPIKTVTLPRLELCAAVLLSKLLAEVKAAIKCKVDQVRLWSDSTIVLSWIKSSPHQFSTFVANRIAEIQNLTSPSVENWKHVASEDNPADCASRGQLPREFVINGLWKTGPSWLQLGKEQWPSHQLVSVELPERKKDVVLAAVKGKTGFDIWTRFSSLAKLIHVVAYCLRLTTRVREKIKLPKILTIVEIQRAFDRIILLVQQEEFSDEIRELSRGGDLPRRSRLIRLNPIIEDGLLRVGGRIKRAELSHDQRHPILVPRNHPFTELLIRDTHERYMHAGINGTLYALRFKFWLIDGRLAVQRVINKCIKCFHVRPKEPSYVMGNLPEVRVTASRVFENAGIDYCGPFYIKEKKFRNKNKIKVYAAVFVCLSVKAVHIELVSDLSTETFWRACDGSLLEEANRQRCIPITEQIS